MDKLICIHGHFYQPPRENPWLESVELQDSAAPYHDWNERITMECYAPNATARILDGANRIEEITSNYSRISFNFGPTLLAWMQDKMPEIHDAIVAADKLSQQNFSGHGSAIAQVYNHMILPLANTADKQTQVIWGIRDFEQRFGRKPEGMWLSETAADLETLDTLARSDIKFTILSPYQASKAREIGKRNWRDVNGGQIDPTRPYLVRLPKGRSIAVFFYDGPVSKAVAFEQLLSSGERFANRLVSAFDDRRQWDQLVHIATDGESYGHHHRHGEMALAYALRHIQDQKLARLTNYGEYLEKHPPVWEAQIHEKSAWSCSHGVGRWMTDCGCNSGGHAGWNQAWRAPLRHSLDWLRDEVAPLFQNLGGELLRDPWKARNDYISVILDRSLENRDRFFVQHGKRELSPEEKVTVLKLMELQRHAMLMYTSCGWFFDELSGIETVQVIQYAARVIQLTRDLFNQDLEGGFLEKLSKAHSNVFEHRNGVEIYNKFVKPAMIDWQKAVAHYAISSIFHAYPDRSRIFSYRIEDEDKQIASSGKSRLAIGRVKVVSEITQESDVLSYAILYLGEHNVTGGVRKYFSAEAYDTMVREIKEAYEKADFPQTIRLLDRHFGETTYDLKSLFKDEQRRILHEILKSTHEDLEGRFRLITERYSPLMRFLQGANVPLPPALGIVSDMVLRGDIRRAVEAEELDLEHLRSLCNEAMARNAGILDAEISFVVKNRMEQMMTQLTEKPEGLEQMRKLEQLAELVMPLPMGLNCWKVQNIYWEMFQAVYPKFQERAAAGDDNAKAWLSQFEALGGRLSFAMEHLKAAPPLQAAA